MKVTEITIVVCFQRLGKENRGTGGQLDDCGYPDYIPFKII